MSHGEDRQAILARRALLVGVALTQLTTGCAERERASSAPTHGQQPKQVPSANSASSAHASDDRDSDGDGVPDRDDRCPEQPGPRDSWSGRGCRPSPCLSVARDLKILERLELTRGSSAIPAASTPILDLIVKVMSEHPDLTVTVVGECAEREPVALSLERANKARSALEQRGVEAARLRARGSEVCTAAQPLVRFETQLRR